MSGAFEMLRIADSSLGMHQTWLDALANNIANVNTVRKTSEDAFQAEYVIAASRPDGGVDVAQIAHGPKEGRLAYDPSHPQADAEGYIRLPDMDNASMMTQLIMAQRGFQASVQVTKNAQGMYDSALSIGKA